MGRHHLPPLHLIAGFEAAARLQSFKDAALELGVTPSAVSQRVRSLEEHLGIALFSRVVRGVELTAAGARYLDEVRRILGQLAAAGEGIACPQHRRLAIAMNSIVAQEMVIPNLPLARHCGFDGEIDVVSRASMKRFAPRDADAGIRIGVGPWPGFEMRSIGPLTTAPLCAPALAPMIRDWDDFFAHTLFCAKSRSAETLEALRHPVDGRSHPKVVGFQTLMEAICAAESGLGVIGGMMPLMNNIVRQGRLQPAFDVERPLPERVLLIHRTDHPDRGALDSVLRWLVECYARLSPAARRAAE